MKPKTNAQRDACELQKHLPAITDAQRKWIVSREEKETLDAYQKSHRKVWSCNYYSIVTTMQGWQIVRYVQTYSVRSRNGFNVAYINEVSQRWMRLAEKQGADLVIFEKAYNFCWYKNRQPYLLDSPLSLKAWSAGYTRKCITDMHMGEDECYPIRRFSEDFKGTLLDKHLIGRYDEINLWDDVLKTTKRKNGKYLLPTIVETLYKMGEADLAEWMIYKDGWEQKDFAKYWRSFIIAHRHGLRIGKKKVLMQWLDYVKMLDRLGEDIRSPHNLVPADGLDVAHDKVMVRIQREDERIKREESKKEIKKWEGKYKKRMKKYFGLLFITPSGISISPLQSVQSFYDEGEALHHCVYECGYYAKKDVLCLSARSKDGLRLETIEVDLKEMKVSQSRGLCNKPTKSHKEILQAMEDNMWQIAEIASPRTALKVAC